MAGWEVWNAERGEPAETVSQSGSGIDIAAVSQNQVLGSFLFYSRGNHYRWWSPARNRSRKSAPRAASNGPAPDYLRALTARVSSMVFNSPSKKPNLCANNPAIFSSAVAKKTCRFDFRTRFRR
jgi:hypothetical protein